MIDLKLLKKLCMAFGPSGNEIEARDMITSEIKDFADEFFVDKVGNLIAFKKGEKTPAKKRLFAAHMDEVGFMVTEIAESGYLKFENLGGIEGAVILGKRAEVGEKRLPAIFGGKPVHMLKKDEREKVRPAEELYLDVGVVEKNKKSVRDIVEVGDFAVFASDFLEFGQNKIKAKALDDRFGCYILIQLLKSKLAFDSYFAFTICEEIGLCGAKTAANIVGPDTAVIFEATTAADIFDKKEKNKVCALGGGAVISLMDNTAIYEKKIVELAIVTAEENNIKTQLKQAVTGGNESGAYQRAGKGATVLAISLPTRYIHSPSCVADIGDMESCLKLALAIEKVI